MKRGTLFLLFLLTLLVRDTASAAGQNPVVADRLDASLHAWRDGNVTLANSLLSEMIEKGTEDARVFYYRGILAEQSGQNGIEDFQMGARLEARFSTSTLVNRALEKIQGPLREKIEKSRVAARNAIKADPEAARLRVVYRDALEARRQGDRTTAIQLLKEAASSGSDPRYFYMYGVTLAEDGQVDEARAAFAEGLKREQTVQDSHLVSVALSDVQGEIRQMIEEQTQIDRGGERVNRQANNRENQRRALMSQDQLLADANAAAEMLLARQQALEEAQTQAAADAILAENKAREELENKINERPSAAAEAPTEAAVAESEVPMPDAPTEPAEEEMTEEVAAVDPAAPANPFLSGIKEAPPTPGTVAPAASAVDMAWLPADTDYLMYARPADLLSSGFLQPVVGTPDFEQSMAKLSAESGLLPTDLDSVTLGVSNAMGMLLPMITQMGSGRPIDPATANQQFMNGNNSMMVMRTKKPIDIAQVMANSGATESTLGDQKYYMLKPMQQALPPGAPAAGASSPAAPASAQNQPPMALYAVDASTFLISTETAIKTAIPKGPGESTSDRFGFVSSSNHMVIAFSNPLLAAMSGSIPEPPGAPPQVGEFLTAVKGNISGVALQFVAGPDLQVYISLNLSESSAATAANAALQQIVVMAKQMTPVMMVQAPQELQPSLQLAVGSLTSTASETVVTASLNVPGSLMKVLKDNPQLMTPPARAPGLAPPGPAPAP